jgi:predicted aldo/keto reductase-like oxidoreductase
VGVIGLGTEHLEQTPEAMNAVIRTAVEAGVNYVDLLYDDPGNAPAFWDNLVPLLHEYRDQLVVATHWGKGPGRGGDLDGAQRCLDQVLARLGNGYADVVIVATIDDEGQWETWAQPAIERLAAYKAQGSVGYVGMSGHFDSTALLAVESGLIDVLMYGVNMVRQGNPDLERLYQACVEREVGLVAMKPYYGGALLNYDGRPTSITPAQCLAYTLSRPVTTAVPGVKNVGELRTTLRYLEASEEERDWRAALPLMYEGLKGQCVRCNHCLPCPSNIDIGNTILCVGFCQWEGVTGWLREWYAALPVPASECIECGLCEERCPFGVEVIAKLGQATELFETG